MRERESVAHQGNCLRELSVKICVAGKAETYTIKSARHSYICVCSHHYVSDVPSNLATQTGLHCLNSGMIPMK